MRRIALPATIAGLLAVAACGGDDDPDVTPPAGADVVTIAVGQSADVHDGDVTVTVDSIDGERVSLTAATADDEVVVEGEPGTRDDVGDREVLVMDVDDDAATIAVGETSESGEPGDGDGGEGGGAGE